MAERVRSRRTSSNCGGYRLWLLWAVLFLLVLVVVIVEMFVVLSRDERLRTKQTRLSQQRQDGKRERRISRWK